MSGPDLAITVVTPTCEPYLREKQFVEAVPYILRKFCYQIPSAAAFASETRFIRSLDQFDAVYLFPGFSQWVLKKVANEAKPIFLERINCHTVTAKTILDEAYSRLGLEPCHTITVESAARETEDISFADYIFCPSSEVLKSYAVAGISKEKLIQSTYGWSPDRFQSRFLTKPHAGSRHCVFLFVGYLSVRKGTHLLLRAWEKAGINGKLVLVGNMEPAIEKACSNVLNRPDVAWHKYSSDVGKAYAEADVFAFPSLEEGSPLVTYEAMAHGLPMLVSPMAAGEIVRDRIDGMVIPPYDEESWIEALRKFSMNPDLRQHCGDSARRRMDEFTWEKVGRRRAAEIVKRMDRRAPIF
ncbi:glycosyltransferase family 4 protein [Bradyrhizobium sp. WYCCWR 13023]|uniref:Glycosyltransferase family 4 protein n=1 Tax=Bradyrhizobium zhengyangense TaxID=2911009 RepID=A0A9X1UF74_9BRAD|nr:glycosyltransferase family 4 protein [Bradyrhizobium zhengyangense]MCG2633194.1 glycosyltransferase family 4 protein [Bradyrhizobium zhengyangense]